MAMARDPGRRPWWKKKRWIAAGILLALAVCFETIPRFPFGPFRLYANLTAEQRAAKIPYDHLSDEASEPFLRGLDLIRNKPLFAARKRFPHVRDCLIATERNAEAPDLRLIDWDLFADHEEAKVCLWRIFASLGSGERIGTWIGFHGYQVSSGHTFGDASLEDTFKMKSWYISGRKSWSGWQMRQPMVPTKGWWRLLLKIDPLFTTERLGVSGSYGKIDVVQFAGVWDI
jgi:hypothetical protein